MSKKLITAVSLMLTFILAFTFNISAATQAELEAQIAQNNAQIQANQEKLDELKEQKSNQQQYLEALEEQIKTVEDKASNLQTQVESIDSQIGKLDKELSQLGNETKAINEDIEQTEKDIKETQSNITDKSETLSAKLRSVYMNGNQSALKILMGSKSLASFLTRLELMKRTSEQDKKVILEFKDEVTELKKDKKKLEKDRKELAEKEAEISAKKDEQKEKKASLVEKQKEYDSTMSSLEGQYGEVEKVMANIDKSSSEYKSYINKLEAENAAADAEIDRILKEYYATQNQQSTTRLPASNAAPGESYQGSGSWYWPIGNTWCYISSEYGYRDASISGWSFHGGIDLAGGSGKLHGAPVYATRAGYVIAAVTSDTGYGIYVLIDHGDGYSSLYAHMSARYVEVGNYVTQGQMIGRVGNTGNSRGAHLHFEIRYYGEKKNPLNYVKNPNG
ncbi:MAG: peptidoglycan DD-metalloendopeptidase family protein [Clostridia bacterium]|nr:peptidoglycan DD-metalloendopeptidase family protein [Clostridia bacterium]